MRTCLLCDKPLSRIWLGAGEDFCSREHRNQYRLRRGMDRLLEANKVASLMRRRESPKPLTPTREIAESEIPRKGFFDPAMAQADDAPQLPGVWNLAKSLRLGLSAEGRFVSGLAESRTQAEGAHRPADAPRLALADAVPVIPNRRVRQRVNIAPAGPAKGQARVRGSLGVNGLPARDASIIWNSEVRLHLDPQRVTKASFHAFEEPHGCRSFASAASRGYSLRVSMGAGFRVQSTKLRGVKLALPRPEVPHVEGDLQLECRLRDGKPGARQFPADRFRQASPGIPKPEWQGPEVHMEWPALLSPWSQEGENDGLRVHAGPELEVRWHGPFRTTPEAAYPPPIRHAGKDAAPPRMALLRPAGVPPMPRAASVAIGCVNDGVDSRPGAPPESRSSIEERFDSGWKNWTGGYSNWTVDAAGARTGSLALFTPSLEWRDYELEFFTRIENRSVSWVYRAAGLNDYYMASLTALPGKGYAFTRRTVWRGKPGAASTAPLSILPNPKNAYLIRMRIAGTQFSLSIDGQLIETWTDSRLAAGGVGFIGAPEDRARIYWVRFYPGPAKEFPRK